MTPLADAHAALSSIVAGLKSNEYLGYDSRRRLLIHAGIVRRGLEAAERPCEWCLKAGLLAASIDEIKAMIAREGAVR